MTLPASLTSDALASIDDPEGAVLALCERGRAALADAHTVAEANAVLQGVKVLEHAVRVVKMAGEAAVSASALRVDAERRVGQMMVAERKAGRLAKQGDNSHTLRPVQDDVAQHDVIKLADLGISRDQAAEYKRLADVDDDTYREKADEVKAEAIARGGTNVTSGAVLRRANPDRERRDEEWWLLASRFADRAASLAKDADDAIKAIRFKKYPGTAWPEGIRHATIRQLEAGQQAIATVLKEMNR